MRLKYLVLFASSAIAQAQPSPGEDTESRPRDGGGGRREACC